MCKPAEWYSKILDTLDRHRMLLCMLSGYLVFYWGGEKFDLWNDKMVGVMNKQAEVQMAQVKAIEGLSVRVDHIDIRTAKLEEYHAMEVGKNKDKKTD